MFLDSAQSILTAVARISTDAVDARPLGSAIRVSNASDDSNRLDRLASSASTANVSFGADAHHRSNRR